MAEQQLATSSTSDRSNVQGKVCKVGRFITEAEGKKIVEEAETWEGTPYSLAGSISRKGQEAGADCSGATNQIYINAGFPYPYKQSINMQEYIESSSRFRRIDPQPGQTLQAGDIILWPKGHIAIYMPFSPSHPKYKTRHKNRKGIEYESINNMWTAFYPGGETFGAHDYTKFRKNEEYFFYRYYLLPDDPRC